MNCMKRICSAVLCLALMLSLLGGLALPTHALGHETVKSNDLPIIPIPPSNPCQNGHDWNEPTYTWSDDNTTCTAKRVCKRDSAHVETETVNAAVQTDAASCTTAGKTVYTAVFANTGFQTQTKTVEIAALGHERALQEGVAATCTENGRKAALYCARCGRYFDYAAYTQNGTLTEIDAASLILPATGHSAGAPTTENRTEPTCTKAGGYDTVIRCTRCQAELSREHTDLPALGHDWDDGVLTPASCTAAGVTTYTCKRCGETKTEAVSAAGHTLGQPAVENEIAATCTVGGSYDTVIRCTVCGAILSSEHTETAALGHDYQAEVTAPTCTAGGYTKHTCKRCGDSYIDSETGAVGHNYVNGVCTVCGEKDPNYMPAPTENPFEDVPANAYYFQPVLWALETGVTGGIDATHFGPNKNCTRAQVVTFLYAAAGKPSLGGGGDNETDILPENPFVDVPADAYYYTPVLWAFSKGITGGIDATHFGPNKTCTRAQVVTFLYSAAGKPNFTATYAPFNDVPADAYYYIPVMWAVQKGVTGGTGPTTFSPNKSCTRAQVVTFLFKAQ